MTLSLDEIHVPLIHYGYKLQYTLLLQVFRQKGFDRTSCNGGTLSYPTSMFWERRQLCNCIHQKLKYVNIKGFTGKAQVAEFAKYLITRAKMLNKITIVCLNDSMKVATDLLSLPKASTNLSINLKFDVN